VCFVDNIPHKSHHKPSKSENDKVQVEDDLNGSEWFRLVPMVGDYLNC